MAIVWTRNLSVGVANIDSQHKKTPTRILFQKLPNWNKTTRRQAGILHSLLTPTPWLWTG